MKKLLMTIMLMMLVLTGCKKSNNASLIPSKASMVVSIDLIGMAEETDLMDSSVYGLICRFLQIDPMEMGLDYRDPLMLFSMPDGTIGLTLSIDDEKTLTDCLTEYARKDITTLPKESNGLMWSKMMGEVQLAYDGKSLLAIMIEEMSASKVKRIMTDLFKMKFEDSFFSTKDYERMDDLSGKDIKMYANLTAMPESVKDFYSILLPKNVKSSDIEIMSYFDSEDGQLVINSELYSDNKKIDDMLTHYEGALKPISGKYFNDIPKEAFMTVIAGLRGEKFYYILKQLPELSQQLSMAEVSTGIDFSNKIKASNDDVMFCMGEYEPLCLNINDEELSLMKGWKSQVLEDLPVDKEDLTQYSLYTYLDIEKFDKSELSRGVPLPSVYRCINNLHAIIIKSKGRGDWTICIQSNNNENFLKQLLE